MPRYRQPYTIYKRGKYYYYKTYRPDGSHTAGKTTGKTSKGAARAYCDNLYLKGDLFHTEILFNNYAADFFSENGIFFSNSVRSYSINTIKLYQNALKNFVLPYFEKAKIGDINYTKLKIYRTWLLNKYSARSAVQALHVLKVIIQTAYRDGIINNNPFQYMEGIPLPEKTRDALTMEEVIKLYNSSSEKYKKGILCIALCGLRVSEYIGLSNNEIKTGIKDGFIFEYIDLKLQKNKNNIIPVKRGSFREFPIIPEIKELINPDYIDYPVWYIEFKKIVNEFENAEDRHLSFHSLRHFFITNAKSEGIAPIKVEYLAGHKLKGQEKVYTNFKAEDVTEIIDWQQKTIKKILK